MAQADQTIQNNTFPTVRADINNNLAALFSNSSGPSEPLTTVAYMDWIDTSGANPVWKKRNAANNAWITLGTIVGNDLEFEGTLPSQSGNAGKYLKTNGTSAIWDSVTAGINDIELFATSGSWTCPAGVTKAFVLVVGGGSGGAGNAGSVANGGYGGFGVGLVTVTPSTIYTITIGAGGAGSNTGAGGAGGSSSFGSVITCTGGGIANANVPGTDGTCTDTAANIYRGTHRPLMPPFIYQNTSTNTSGLAAAAWSNLGTLLPGSRGQGETSSVSNNAAGGIGGAVIVWY